MRIRHGGLSVEIPGDWSDESTLLFAAPEPTGAGTTLRQALAVKIHLVPEGSQPRDVLAARAEALQQGGADFTVEPRGAIASGLGEGWSQIERLVVDDNAVKMLVAVFCLGNVAVIAVASCADADFGRREADLVSLVGSLRTEKPAG